MIDLKEGDQGQCSQAIHHHNMQSYQDQFFLHQQQQMQQQDTGFVNPSEVSPLLPWSLTQVNSFNPAHFGANPGREHHPLFLPPPPPAPPSSSYESLINRPSSRASAVPLQFAYDHHGSSVHLQRDQLRIISDALGPMVVQHGSAAPFGLQAELNKMTAQEIMDAKALAASKSHSEAERRRRERINNHFAKLRSLLPSTTKTDKASLLAEVIQHVKELKRQTSLIAETSPVPTETDELTVDNAADEEGRLVIKASLCCDDRSDLLPDLINTLKALSFRTLKAEITTLGGRVKNVLFITGDDHTDNSNNNQDQSSTCTTFCDQQQQQYCVSSIQEALRAVMEKASGDDCASAGSVKRQRTNLNNL